MKFTSLLFSLIFVLGHSSASIARSDDDRGRGRDDGYDSGHDRDHDRRHRKPRPRPRPDRPERPETPDRYQDAAVEMFTVSGIRLGYTTAHEIRSLGGMRTDYEYNYYEYAGYKFWYHDSIYVHGMYVVPGLSDSRIPYEWTSKGFRSDISYDEALRLLRNLGFTIKIENAPKQEYYSPGGYYAFSAKIEGSIRDRNNKLLVLLFDFSYERGTSSSRGTLYSITATAEVKL